MVAALFAFLLFLFLTLLGKAVIEALSFRFSILRGWLLAPSVGMAAVVLLTLNINQAGLPVKSFASPLAVALAVFIGGVFWWKRPVFPWKQLGPFLGAAVFSLLYTCWPMFQYGFRWFGYMNGDMAQYCLGAARVMNHGFYQIPTLQELNGTDYTQFMWFHSAVGMFRCGADIFLAWVASLAHDQPLRISMPTMGAAEMAQLWSAAALILNTTSYRRLALATALFVAASPFYILGVMAQLLPQVGGLALLFCLCTLCMRPLQAGSEWRVVVPNAVLIAAIAAASCIYYPEALPFGAAALIAYHGNFLIRRKEKVSAVVALGIPALILLAVFARQGILTALGTIVFTLASVPRGIMPTRDFDTVLDPSIFASLPGLAAYYGQHRDPWISIAIALGIVLLLLSVWIGFRYAWKGQPAAFVLLVMLALGVQLFSSHAAFGLFKLAMYIQPVYLFALAVVAVRFLGKKWYLAPALYLPVTMATAHLYVSASEGSLNPSTLPGIDNTLVRSLPLGPSGETVVSSQNQVGAIIYAAESAGTKVKWADLNYFVGATATDFMPALLLRLPSQLDLTADYLRPADNLRRIVMSDNAGEEVILDHRVPCRGVPTSAAQVSYLGAPAFDPWHSSNNTRLNGKKDNNYFGFDRIDKISDYIVLLTSDKGGPFGPGIRKVSRWPPEKDMYDRQGTFYGVGRHLLFEVIHPSSTVRLRISLTRTLTGEGRTSLPESAEMNAAANQRLGFVGNGAANIITSPVQFYERNGRFYFALDFGTEGNYFPSHKTGLLRMFNTDILIDNRQMVGLARDLGLITDSQYQTLGRPTSITSWPAGLLNPNLEFSGIYEDGWISNRAFVVLGKAKAGDQLHITGQVPSLPRFTTSGIGSRVLLNGKLIYQSHLKPGPFEVANTIAADSTESRVDFFFDQMDQLPGGDGRPVSAQLFGIAIKGASSATSHERPEKERGKILRSVLLAPQGE
jgi:hypothetical protein